MSGRLVATDEFGAAGCYRIAWWFAEESDYGAILGEATYKDKDLEAIRSGQNPTDSDIEHVAATLAVAELAAGRDVTGYYWESRAKAAAALKVAKAAIAAAKSDRPWPEWAVKAKAAGWKPPKGWKP